VCVCVFGQAPNIDNVVVYQDAMLEDEIVCDVEFRCTACQITVKLNTQI